MSKVYYLRDAAEMCGVKVRTAREWIKLGKLDAHKKQGSRMWLVNEEEISRVRGILDDNKNREHSTGTKRRKQLGMLGGNGQSAEKPVKRKERSK